MCFGPWLGSFQHGARAFSPLLPFKKTVLVEELKTLPSLKCVGHWNLQAICLVSLECEFYLLRQKRSPLPDEMRCSKKILVYIFERHLICCLLDDIVLRWQVRVRGIMQPQTDGHSRLFCSPLASLMHKNRYLSSSSVQASICPRFPGRVRFNRVWFLGFSLVVLSRSPHQTDGQHFSVARK